MSNGEPPPFVLWLAWVGVGRAEEIGEGLDGGSLVWLGRLIIEVAKEEVSVGTDVSTSIAVVLEDWEDEADDDVVVAARPCEVEVCGWFCDRVDVATPTVVTTALGHSAGIP